MKIVTVLNKPLLKSIALRSIRISESGIIRTRERAFTSAVKTELEFEAAGGTIFLDEVAI
jgi:DNA-binding NtrC family response regulator